MGTNACENLEEVQVLLGHTLVQTTERNVGLKQQIRYAVNDRMASSNRGLLFLIA